MAHGTQRVMAFRPLRHGGDHRTGAEGGMLAGESHDILLLAAIQMAAIGEDNRDAVRPAPA